MSAIDHVLKFLDEATAEVVPMWSESRYPFGAV